MMIGGGIFSAQVAASGGWWLPTGITAGNVEDYGTDLTANTSYGGSDLTDSDFTIAMSFTASDYAQIDFMQTGNTDTYILFRWLSNDSLRVYVTGITSKTTASGITSGVRTSIVTYDYSAETFTVYFDAAGVSTPATGITSIDWNNATWWGSRLELHYYAAYNVTFTSDQVTEWHNNVTA